MTTIDPTVHAGGDVPAPVLEAYRVVKSYHPKGGDPVHALDGVTLGIGKNETVGLIGESGSGKTTLMRLLLGIEDPTSGSIRFRGRDRTEGDRNEREDFCDSVAAVFQNPYSSLNPRRRLWETITERSAIAGGRSTAERRERARELLDLVALPEDYLDRFPRQLSGGQRQRVAIARALSESPEVIILDEPMSALDVSVSAQIANLLLDLQDRLGVSYLFVGHDMRMVRHLCHRVAVLLRGRIVEEGTVTDVLGEAQHQYTRSLLLSSEMTTLLPSEQWNSCDDIPPNVSDRTPPSAPAEPPALPGQTNHSPGVSTPFAAQPDLDTVDPEVLSANETQA